MYDEQKHELIDRYAGEREEKQLLSNVYDKLKRGMTKNILVSTGFLSEHQQAAAQAIARALRIREDEYFLYGGPEEAERKLMFYLPDYMERDMLLDSDDLPLAAVRITPHQGDKLTHRDYLGSILGLGIKRDVVGDLYVSENSCDVIASPDIAEFIKANLEYVKHEKVSCEIIGLSDVTVPAPKVKEISTTVSTLRLDSVLASGFQLSRGTAQDLIRSDKVEVNHVEAHKPDYPVNEGDLISARGYGRIRLKEVRGQTRKDRTSVTIIKYL